MMNKLVNSAWDDKHIYLTSNKKSFGEFHNALCSASQTYLAYCKGSQCSNEKSMHETMQRIFRFPDYYGKNRMALDECINDLEWLWNYNMSIVFDEKEGSQAIRAIFLLIEHCEEMFQNEHDQHEWISDFVALLYKTKEKWERGSCFAPWDLSYPIFFKIHLHCDQKNYRQISQSIARGIDRFNQSKNFHIHEIENYQGTDC